MTIHIIHINNLKGEIEVALQNKRTVQEYVDILHSNLEECHRLTRIIDNLTFLSRSEKHNIHIQAEEIDIHQELLNMKDLYDGKYKVRKITENGKTQTLTFSGDVGRYGDMILKSPKQFPQADFIIIESTYGNSLHSNFKPSNVV